MINAKKSDWVIVLGGQTFAVGLFPLARIGRALEVFDAAMLPLHQGGSTGAQALIAIALEPKLCAQEIRDGMPAEEVAALALARAGALEATPVQILEAITTIGAASGILRLGEPPAAAEAPASG